MHDRCSFYSGVNLVKKSLEPKPSRDELINKANGIRSEIANVQQLRGAAPPGLVVQYDATLTGLVNQLNEVYKQLASTTATR